MHTSYWWRVTKKHRFQTKDHPNLNQRGQGQRYVGKVCTLLEPIKDGEGKVHLLDDTVWSVKAEHDIPKDKKIRIIGVNGTILKVEINKPK